jgi:hypothetical protein
MRPGGLPINVLTFMINVHTFYESSRALGKCALVKPDEGQNGIAHSKNNQEIWRDRQATWVSYPVGVRLMQSWWMVFSAMSVKAETDGCTVT